MNNRLVIGAALARSLREIAAHTDLPLPVSRGWQVRICSRTRRGPGAPYLVRIDRSFPRAPSVAVRAEIVSADFEERPPVLRFSRLVSLPPAAAPSPDWTHPRQLASPPPRAQGRAARTALGLHHHLSLPV